MTHFNQILSINVEYLVLEMEEIMIKRFYYYQLILFKRWIIKYGLLYIVLLNNCRGNIGKGHFNHFLTINTLYFM